VDAPLLRELERILIVVGSGMCIFLGYRLFLKMPRQTNSEGKVLLPGGVSIYLSRIGPGAFFALFGCIVLGLSFRYAITYSEKSTVTEHGAGDAGPAAKVSETSTTRNFSGFNDATGIRPLERLSTDRLQVRATLDFLNGTLPGLLNPMLSSRRRNDIELNMPRVRLALVQSVWGPDWGDFEAFRKWVERGAPQPPPRDFIEPAALYWHGRPR
jgi:hypothetical protein